MYNINYCISTKKYNEIKERLCNMKKNYLLGMVLSLVVVATVGITSIDAEAKIYVPTEDLVIHEFMTDDVEEADYKVLFMGNSITFHIVCDYWWGSWGMAASSADKDYVHQVVAGLSAIYETVDYDVISSSIWERPAVRSNILPSMEAVIGHDYDLVVIQLGENARDTTNFEADYETLVEFVKNNNPEAQVVLVGDFWYKAGRDAMKIGVAERLNCDYVDISDFRKNLKYQSYKGDKVYGEDGNIHEVDFDPVTVHPNDLGMKTIAERILDKVDLNSNIEE